MSNRLKRLISVDWDAIAGVLAAVIALILHLLHVVQPGILRTIVLMILALLLIRDLRREHPEGRLFEIIPRYVFHVQGHSELVARLSDIERQARMRS